MRPDPPAQARARRLAVLGSAVLSLAASLGFVLAPVDRPDAVYGWPTAPGDASAVAVPLMLGRPAELTASGSCADARDAGPGTVLLSTTPLEDAQGAVPQAGLRATVSDAGTLRIRTAGTDLAEVELAGDCTWELVTTRGTTTLRVDGAVLDERTGDLRPAVAGVFTGLDDPGDAAVAITADTVFQTTPSVVKTALGAVAVLALLAALVLVGRRRGARPAQVRADADTEGGAVGATAVPARRGGRPVRWLVDAGVVLSLAYWTVAGPMTVDDGYIAGIVRSREANGYVGNVYRWFNAPEAPFGWFYEVLGAWAGVGASTAWMRVPSLLLGVLTWLVVSRALLPRLGAFARGPWPHAVAGLAFLLWWLPSNAGLRPEAWVAAGAAVVLVLVERGLARRSLIPLALGLVVAGATLAVTPTGAVAFLPFLAAAVPVLRVCRGSGWGLWTATALGAAAAASALLLMFADQSLAAVSLANEVRADLPGTVPWYTEIDRYDALLSEGHEGSLARRVPVLLTFLAVAGILWQRIAGRLRDDVRADAALRLTAVFGLSLLLLLFTPTKWTMHFGALVPVGTALLVLAVHQFAGEEREPARPGIRERLPLDTVTGRAVSLAAVLLVTAVCWAGANTWPYLSDLDVPWNRVGPQLRGVTAWAVSLTGAVLAAAVGAGAVVRARVRGEDAVHLPFWRWVPSAGAVLVVVALLTVGLQLTSFLKSTWDRRDTYTLASDARATVGGRPCGLAEELAVEPDPTRGLLTAAGGTGELLDGFAAVPEGDAPAGPPLAMAGRELPGWAATGHVAEDGSGPAELTTAWFELPDDLREGGLPLVVTVSGDLGAGTGLTAEFGAAAADGTTPVGNAGLGDPGGGPGARDLRLDASAVPPDAGWVRLRAVDGGADDDVPLAVSAPRVPVTERFADVVDPDVPALVDWPVAFVFPCQTLAVQRGGVTDVPDWRIATALPSDAGDIVIAGVTGGPYTAARSLVDQVEVPVYQDGRPLDRPVTLYSWRPRTDHAEPRRDVTEETVAGWTP